MESSLGNKSTCIKNSQTAAGLIGEPVGYMLYTRHQTSQMPGKNAKSLQKKSAFVPCGWLRIDCGLFRKDSQLQ